MRVNIFPGFGIYVAIAMSSQFSVEQKQLASYKREDLMIVLLLYCYKHRPKSKAKREKLRDLHVPSVS